jgi:hypothetical protein
LELCASFLFLCTVGLLLNEGPSPLIRFLRQATCSNPDHQGLKEEIERFANNKENESENGITNGNTKTCYKTLYTNQWLSFAYKKYSGFLLPCRQYLKNSNDTEIFHKKYINGY